MKPPLDRASLTADEQKLLRVFHQLSQAEQACMRLILKIMADLQDDEYALFTGWIDESRRRPGRTPEQELKTLRTGRWRVEATRMQRTRVLHLRAGGKSGGPSR